MELRRHKRYRVNRGFVRAAWLDAHGNLHAANVKVRDISSGGLGIELPEPLPEFATIKLKSSLHGLDGTAVVRRCKLSGLSYIVGLEFEDIHWTPPPEPAPGLINLSDRVSRCSAPKAPQETPSRVPVIH
jgi:PilZ domain-containing protein